MVTYFRDLSDVEKSRLCDFMLAKRVSLFVGSGVSLDSCGSDADLISAADLRKALIKVNSLPETTSLQQAYSLLSSAEVEEHITKRYICTKPGATIKRIAAQPWQRIYSLNVDNCFERAFEAVIEENEFDPASMEVINFDDGFSELLNDKRCSIVHLHGLVERPESGYVFSRNEYAKLMARQNSWMLTLSQLIRSDCFIVAGTSFDEIDVEYYLEQRSAKTVRGDIPPSVLIEPFPNRLTERLCENHKFCLYQGTVLEFFEELEQIDSRLRRPWIDNEKDGLAGLHLSKSERVRFSASFDIVPDQPDLRPNPARFLLGAELSWSMLAANTDISRDVFADVRKVIADALVDPEFQLLLLIDGAGSGKTAFMKRLAFDLSRGSDAVFWYTGLGLQMEPDEIKSVLEAIKGPVAIFVDNFADSLNSIALIIKELKKENILFICAERDYRLSYIENAFTAVTCPPEFRPF